jgi:pyruvate/2-oxoglutarate dehydrogenase complex dihydrolipoamide dehydrogenase (E3) component
LSCDTRSPAPIKTARQSINACQRQSTSASSFLPRHSQADCRASLIQIVAPHIGINESDAQRQGIAVRVAKLPMAAVPRARTTGEMHGFMKAIVDAESERILGFTMLGSNAGEVVASVQMAMLGNLPYTAVRDAILSHPTIAEGLNMLFAKIPERA